MNYIVQTIDYESVKPGWGWGSDAPNWIHMMETKDLADAKAHKYKYVADGRETRIIREDESGCRTDMEGEPL